MVKYKSDGVFDASLDKIWKYMQSGEQDHAHSQLKNFKPVKQEGAVMVFDFDAKTPDGKWAASQVKYTMTPPKGFEAEMLKGPMAGSKFTHVYTAQGGKTKVEVEGEFKLQGVADEKVTLKAVDDFFTTAFTEDNKNLQKFKS
jgi:ligand-binding SRPBCC domain-containing protein